MFQNLFDMALKRTGLQALGFYIFYTLVGITAVGLLSGAGAVTYCQISNICTPENAVAIGRKIGAVVGWVACIFYITGIGAWIVKSKNIYKRANAIILYIFAVLLSFVLGACLPLIILAVLTTFDNGDLDKNKELAE